MEPLYQIQEAIESDPYPDDLGDFITEDGEWTCIECGACCMDVRWNLPHWTNDSDGKSCSKLCGTRCSIYSDRPLSCNVKEYSEAMGTEELLAPRRMAACCSFMRSAWGTPDESS